MKQKLLMLVLGLCFLAPTVNAQNKALEKARKKEYKQKMKMYKEEGWKLFASSRSLDVALLTHYDKLNTMGEDGQEIVGVATKCRSKNVGRQMALNNACVTYAQQAGSKVKGRVVSDMQGDGVNAAGEFEKFYAAYERLVDKEIRGEMKESYSIIRENGDGTFEIQTYFIVNESAASQARLRAMEQASKETEMAQQYAKKISDFVKEGFKQE